MRDRIRECHIRMTRYKIVPRARFLDRRVSQQNRYSKIAPKSQNHFHRFYVTFMPRKSKAKLARMEIFSKIKSETRQHEGRSSKGKRLTRKMNVLLLPLVVV